jgi:hypothetical protein
MAKGTTMSGIDPGYTPPPGRAPPRDDLIYRLLK